MSLDAILIAVFVIIAAVFVYKRLKSSSRFPDEVREARIKALEWALDGGEGHSHAYDCRSLDQPGPRKDETYEMFRARFLKACTCHVGAIREELERLKAERPKEQ